MRYCWVLVARYRMAIRQQYEKGKGEKLKYAFRVVWTRWHKFGTQLIDWVLIMHHLAQAHFLTFFGCFS